MALERSTEVAGSNLPPIKRDPILTDLIKMRTFGFWSLGIWFILMALAFAFSWISHIKVFYLPYMLVNPNILLICGIILPFNAFFQIRPYKKMEQKRQSVAQGKQIFLADQQPVPGSSTPVLPLVIRYQIYWPIILMVLGIFTVIIMLLFVANIWFSFSQVQITTFLFDCIAFFTIIVYATVLQGNKQLVFDEAGLSMKAILPTKVRYIPWDKVRFFAIDALSFDPKISNKLPLTFEVASEQEVIRWQGSNAGRKDRVIKPIGKSEQYEQQIQAANALIVEKTGLSLYDLRK